MSRALFESAGKFDPEYVHYGFEDRDLIIRVVRHDPKMAYVPDAAVSHEDDLTLEKVCRKMYISGRYTSTIFQGKYPDEYAKTHFFLVDVRCNGVFMKICSSVVGKLLPAMVWIGHAILKSPLSYGIKSRAVKICSGFSYMAGTREAFLATEKAKDAS